MSDFFDNDRFRALLSVSPNRALTLLHEHYHHRLMLCSLRYTHDARASEDILQEVMVHLWEMHQQLGQPHPQSIWHYIVRVVRNKSITYYKHQRTLQERQEALALQPIDLALPSAQDRMVRNEVSAAVRAAIASFPRRERECLTMRLDEELSLDEMAARLGVKRKAVQRSLTSGFKRLRALWRRKGEK